MAYKIYKIVAALHTIGKKPCKGIVRENNIIGGKPAKGIKRENNIDINPNNKVSLLILFLLVIYFSYY